MTAPALLDEVLLDLVALIPAGSLVSYADLARLATELGFSCTARRAARSLSMYGAEVPWWRVVQSSGTVADAVLATATPLLSRDGLRLSGRRVPLAEVRWCPDVEVLRSLVELPGSSPNPARRPAV